MYIKFTFTLFLVQNILNMNNQWTFDLKILKNVTGEKLSMV